MASGAGSGSGGAVSLSVKKTIQSIKEVVGGHSEAEILAVLRESNMDPNETAQKLLYQDPFHEVKRKRDKKKEQIIGQKSLPVGKEPLYQGTQWMNARPQRYHNDQQKFYPQNQQNGHYDAGSNHEFRVVRDNRAHNVGETNKPDPVSATQSQTEGLTADAADRSSGDQGVSHGSTSIPVYRKRSNDPQVKGEAQNNVDLPDKSSLNGPRLSTSDPARVPYQYSKATGNIGTVRHQAVVRNVERWPERSIEFSNPGAFGFHQRREISNEGPYGRPTYISRGIQYNQRHVGHLPAATQKVNRYHQASLQTKAMQPNMEWKPKPIKKLAVESAEETATNSEPLTQDGSDSAVPDASSLSNSAHATLSDEQHVIIPDHFRVSVSEQAQLRFGSFASGLDSSEHGHSSEESEMSEKSSIMEPVPVDVSAAISSGHKDIDEQARYFAHVTSTLATESAVVHPEDSNYLDDQKGGISNDLGLVGNDVQLLSSPEARNLQSTSSMPGFSEYEADANSDVPLFRLTDPNVPTQGSPPPSEALGLVSRVDSNRTVINSTPQLQSAQPQTASQLYTQVHMPHYPNYMPYRPVFPPVYVPTMAMPNFSSNIAYPHPPNGNNYVQMPGGNSQLGANPMKYGVSQYKSIATGSPTGYGNYTQPSGFTYSSPGVIGGTVGLDELNRMKYKDNGVYVSNSQVETADSIWMQSGRDIQTMQPSPYYNLSGTATPTAAAYVPTAGNQPFNATAQPSHAQFQGLYHPQQPTPIVGPHHMVHQQVAPSPVGGGIAVGVAGPNAQVGGYQQQQLGHLNWRPNF